MGRHRLRGVLFRLIAVIAMIAIPAQGLAAAVAALKGPAHYHVVPRAAAAHAAHRHAHTHAHGSAGGEVERHYHLPGAAAIVVGGADGEESAPAKAESQGAAFVAVLGAAHGINTPVLAQSLFASSPASPRSCVPRCIERPPCRELRSTSDRPPAR